MSKYTDIVPPLSDAEYADLKTSIKNHGIQVPIIVDEEKVALDGGHRLKIAAELKIPQEKIPYTIKGDLADDEAKMAYALEINVRRRQLNKQQKDKLIRDLLKKGWSIRFVARNVDASVGKVQKEAATVRQEKGATEVKGTDGRTYQSTTPAREAAGAKRRADNATPKAEPAELPEDEEERSEQASARNGSKPVAPAPTPQGANIPKRVNDMCVKWHDAVELNTAQRYGYEMKTYVAPQDDGRARIEIHIKWFDWVIKSANEYREECEKIIAGMDDKADPDAEGDHK